MLIKYQALATLLQKKLQAFYVLVGNDSYLLNDAAVQIKKAFQERSEYSQTVLDISSPNDWSLLIAEANSYSLFSEHVLIDARYDKKSIEAIGKELITDYLKNINERCLIILRAPLLSAKPPQWLIDSPLAIVVQSSPLTDQALKQWIEKQFKSLNIQTEAHVPEQIQHYTQGNMLAAAQLIEKLSLHCSPGEIVTKSLINEHLSDQSHFELYALAETCLNGDAPKALRLLQRARAERAEPTFVLWILTQEIRLLIQLKHLLTQSETLTNACSQLKIWPSRIKFYTKATSRLSTEQLFKLLHECKLADDMIKTSQGSRIWNTFDAIALSLCAIEITLP